MRSARNLLVAQVIGVMVLFELVLAFHTPSTYVFLLINAVLAIYNVHGYYNLVRYVASPVCQVDVEEVQE